MTGDLQNGCQVVWVREHSFLSPPAGSERGLQRFYVSPGIDKGLETLSSRLLKQNGMVASCLNLLGFSN